MRGTGSTPAALFEIKDARGTHRTTVEVVEVFLPSSLLASLSSAPFSEFLLLLRLRVELPTVAGVSSTRGGSDECSPRPGDGNDARSGELGANQYRVLGCTLLTVARDRLIPILIICSAPRVWGIIAVFTHEDRGAFSGIRALFLERMLSRSSRGRLAE
ncbi:hypothetical protein NPX13_g4619 [Xylaria arbuscula]|uniref:Uncharacterized protein n=1 Tax=Xylaria arbuscula TaxID=114810 RepID=A0A9W8TN55_9PEZI|nr:hypothetical protein NPX13_g4619 [Xylaria arbuscula]